MSEDLVLQLKVVVCDLMVSYATVGQVTTFAALETAVCGISTPADANEIFERMQTMGFVFIYDVEKLSSVYLNLAHLFSAEFLKNYVVSYDVWCRTQTFISN